MSTKTTFKRVALVAVAALGLGVLSVVPSNAAFITSTITPSATTSAIKTGETATIKVTVNAILGAQTDSATVKAALTRGASGTLTFQGTTDSTTTNIRGTGYQGNTIILDSQTASAGDVLRGVVELNFVNPTSAGTYEVTVYGQNGNTAPSSVDAKSFVWTITVTADSKLADTSSTSIIKSGRWSGVAPTVDAAVSATKVYSASTPVATIAVVQKNATSSATEAYTAVVSGPGFILEVTDTSSNAGSTSRVLSVAAPAVAATKYFLVYGDGTTGVGTITFTTNSGVVIGQETVTFVDTKPATVTAVVKKAYIAAGKTNPKTFAVTVKDTAGNAITGSAVTITGTPSDTSTAAKAIASADLTCGNYDTTDKVWYCSAIGASSSKFGAAGYTITATGTDADATKVTTTASTIYADIVATSVTVTAPASASIGDKITYTLTAKEKNGYPVADSTYEGAFNDSTLGQFGGIFWNTTTVPDYTSSSVKPFNAGETITTVSGVATKDIYMPVAAGSVTATWVLAGSATSPVGAVDKTIAGTTITVTTAVTNPGVDSATDAANEATDAANAATDAALAAADAADAATAAAEDASAAVATLAKSVNTALASLKKQITALTALVNKLLKK